MKKIWTHLNEPSASPQFNDYEYLVVGKDGHIYSIVSTVDADHHRLTWREKVRLFLGI